MFRPLIRIFSTARPPHHLISNSAVRLQPCRPRLEYNISGATLLRVDRRLTAPPPPIVARKAPFHSTSRNEGGPLIPLFISVLKASTAIEFARTAGRIAMTFIPVILFKNHKTRRFLRTAQLHGIPASDEKKSILMKKIRHRTIAFHVLIFVPIFLFWATIVASLERTPLTGRWRMIVLSPEEEEEIAAQLAGPGWYQAIGEILSQEGPPQLVPTNDWRYTWVKETLRKLEATIPILQQEGEMELTWIDGGPNGTPLPPPAEYPLRPRPRAVQNIRWFCDVVCERGKQLLPAPHAIAGPPYSLLVVEKPDSSNAFSYGFGPDGGGGVVVYSGFLDDVLSRHPSSPPSHSQDETSWWSFIFSGFLSRTPQPPHPVPTAEQTSELAILLAHELSHLILSHHLETLSSGTVIVPGFISMGTDIIRVLLFPITMMFGPFVNDAVAQLGKVGSGELIKVGEYCTSVQQEIEADVVSARLLAHAGFDPRSAVCFWEDRKITAKTGECSAKPTDSKPGTSLARRIAGSGHPVHEVRVEKLKAELVRWEVERRAALSRQKGLPESSSIILAAA